MRLSFVLLVLPLAGLFRTNAGESDTNGETRVTVRKGTLIVEREEATTKLEAGQEARLAKGAPAEIVGTERSASPAALPIAVRWEPGQAVLLADGEKILLRPGVFGSEGASTDGRYTARLGRENELQVIDGQQRRQAVRLPDGRWVHRFAGCEMRVDPQGRTTVRLPDGHEIVSVEPSHEPSRPPGPPASVETPAGYRWQIGIHLDKTARGLRVAGVSPGSPAEAADFRPNDEVLAIGELRSPTLAQIQERLKQARPAQRIPFTVRRDGRTMTLTVLMGAWE